MNQPIIKRLKLCDISHDTKTILSHMSLDVFVCDHRCAKYFNTFVLEHIECEIIGNFLKVGIIVEKMFRAIEYVLSRGSLSEDLSLADIKIKVSIFFEHVFQERYELSQNKNSLQEDCPLPFSPSVPAAYSGVFLSSKR